MADGHPGGVPPTLEETLESLGRAVAEDRNAVAARFAEQWGFEVAWQELNWRWEFEDYYFYRGSVCFVFQKNPATKTLSLWVGMVEPGEKPPPREDMQRVTSDWHRVSSREELAVRLSRAEEHGKLTLQP